MNMNMTVKWILGAGCFFAMLSVVLGAFGAHFLKSRLDDYSLGIFEVGVRYQFYHAFALILFAYYLLHTQSTSSAAAIAFAIGIVVFSGSLYALALSGIKILGAITPIGGLAFIVGWLLWLVKIFSQ